MLGFIRLAAVIIIAFLAGMFVEGEFQKDKCADAGGAWAPAGVCDLD